MSPEVGAVKERMSDGCSAEFLDMVHSHLSCMARSALSLSLVRTLLFLGHPVDSTRKQFILLHFENQPKRRRSL